jgi:hypothetical protein
MEVTGQPPLCRPGQRQSQGNCTKMDSVMVVENLELDSKTSSNVEFLELLSYATKNYEYNNNRSRMRQD